MLRLNITSLLAKIEGAYATDSSPTGTANAILIRGTPTITPMEMTQVERNLIRTFYGSHELLPSSIYGKLDFEVEAAGSGTAGVAPAWGPLARGCGLSETLTAAPISATGQAGGTTTTTVLAAGASAIDNFYTGMPISITAGTGNGQSGIIINYVGATKTATVASSSWVATDATSTYSIGANVAYRPISNSQESISTYFDIDGVLHKFLGVRGNVKASVKVNEVPGLVFSFMGLYQTVADTAIPASVFTGWQKPLPANKANTPFFHLHGVSTLGLESFDFDLGNQVEHFELINATEQMIQTDRNSVANLSMEAATVGTKDWWTIAKNATLGPFALTHGTAAGNKITFSSGFTQLIQPKYGNRNNIATLQMQNRFVPSAGNDEFSIVTY